MNYTELEKTYIWISYIEDIGYKKQKMLLDLFDDPTILYKDTIRYKSHIVEIIGEKHYNQLIDLVEDKVIEKYIVNLENLGIKVVTLVSNNYPELLKNIDTPPLVLYCKGDISLLNKECISVVGTRRMTRYGSDVTKKFVTVLAKSGLVIVSGLADGIDTASHKTALEVGGKTIAILGSGVNHIYPANNTELAKNIVANGGLILSEYKPNTEPKAFHFPIRNRIIAGLSKGVLICEATLNSGSMHTKQYALDYGRDLFVVPGRINDIYSAGCNAILRDLQGAMVLEPNDILKVYHKDFSTKNVEQPSVEVTITEQNILDIIGNDDVHIDEIMSKSKLDAKTLMTQLMRLQLKGLIKTSGGNIYSK